MLFNSPSWYHPKNLQFVDGTPLSILSDEDGEFYLSSPSNTNSIRTSTEDNAFYRKFSFFLPLARKGQYWPSLLSRLDQLLKWQMAFSFGSHFEWTLTAPLWNVHEIKYHNNPSRQVETFLEDCPLQQVVASYLASMGFVVFLFALSAFKIP